MVPKRISGRRRTGASQFDIPFTDLERSFSHAAIESLMHLTLLTGDIIPQFINRELQKGANLRNWRQLVCQLLDLFQ